MIFCVVMMREEISSWTGYPSLLIDIASHRDGLNLRY